MEFLRRAQVLVYLCLCLVFFSYYGLAFIQTTDLDAKQILEKVDNLLRSDSSHGKIHMDIKTTHWNRKLDIEFWSKGKDKTLLRILYPKKERGTTTLRSGNNIWNFLPKVNRVIKVPSSMVARSWMGSHFTNDDLVKHTWMAEDYSFEISSERTEEGRQLVEITCIPRPEAPVVWGKVIVTVNRETHLPLSIHYYDEDLQLVRTMIFSDVGPLGNKIVPRHIIVKPADKNNESTVVYYREFAFDLPLDDRLFSLHSLQK